MALIIKNGTIITASDTFQADILVEDGRIAAMNLGDDGMLAAAILMRIAADYERAREAKAAGTIPLESLNAENDE